MKRKNILLFWTVFLGCLQFTVITYGLGANKNNFSPELRKPQGILAEEVKAEPEIGIHKTTDYVLGEEDVIDVTVWQDLRKKGEGPKEEYAIKEADVLNVSVWQWPDLDKEVIVRPDGKVSFPLVGDIEAEGLSLSALDDTITEKLKDFIKSPEVSVMITQFGSGKQSSSELPFGKLEDASLTMVIPPGGKIDFPFVGEIMAGGLTLEQLKQKLTLKLSEYISNPEVHVAIQSFGGRKIIVLGEVTDPGVYLSTGRVSVMEAIALAGGYTRDAVLKNVVVIRGNLSNPEVFVLDLHKVLKNMDLSQNIMIEPRDVIYVPRTVIAEVNYYIGKLLEPFTSSSSAVTAIKTIRMGPSPKK